MTTTTAIFDLDGTLFSGNVWRGVVRYVQQHRRNRGAMYSFLAAHLPLYVLSKTALVSREQVWLAWARNMWGSLRGMDAAEAARVFAWLTDEYIMPHARPEIVELLHEHQTRGAEIILLSGTAEDLLAVVGTRWGVNIALGTPLETDNGYYTGRTLEPVCQGAGKAARLRAHLAEREGGIDLSASYAYADSEFDLAVLELVGNPVAVYPDRSLRKIAVRRGWRVIERIA